jgi:hypothetical protein
MKKNLNDLCLISLFLLCLYQISLVNAQQPQSLEKDEGPLKRDNILSFKKFDKSKKIIEQYVLIEEESSYYFQLLDSHKIQKTLKLNTQSAQDLKTKFLKVVFTLKYELADSALDNCQKDYELAIFDDKVIVCKEERSKMSLASDLKNVLEKKF